MLRVRKDNRSMRVMACALRFALSVGFVAASIFTASSQELPTDPAALGFSVERLARVGNALEGDIKKGAFRVPFCW
jgi:hypothetical protein